MVCGRVSGLGKSPTLLINEESSAMVGRGETVFRFGFGQSPFPVPDVVVGALQRHAAEKEYEPVAGVRALQEAVAGHMSARIGRTVAAGDVMIGPGSKELLMALQMVFAGPVFVPAASWVSYLPQALLAGREHAVIPTARADGWKLTPAGVDAFLAARPRDEHKLLILNYPSNPTGLTYSAAELAALAPVFAAHNVVVVADEIYGNVDHHGTHASLAAAYPEATIVADGLSKWAGAGGWRVGHFCFPPQLAALRDAMHVVASETFSATSAPIQHAAVTAYAPPDSDAGAEIAAYVAAERGILAAVGRFTAQSAAAAGFATPLPDGGFYVFPSANDAHGDALAARGITTNVELATAVLAETGVAALPGAPFSVPDHELSLRLAFVDFDGRAALDAWMSTGTADVERDAPRVVEGMSRLSAWFGRL